MVIFQQLGHPIQRNLMLFFVDQPLLGLDNIPDQRAERYRLFTREFIERLLGLDR